MWILYTHPSLFVNLQLTVCFLGWYEDSVFHVNGFGFPPTEPSSATRSEEEQLYYKIYILTLHSSIKYEFLCV